MSEEPVSEPSGAGSFNVREQATGLAEFIAVPALGRR